MTAASKWEDLKTRSASSLLMVAVGAGEIWLGGSWFLALIVIACGLMIWELVRMVARDAAGLALGLGLLAGASVLGAILLKLPVLLVLPVLLGGVAVSRHRVMYLLYAPVVMAGAYGLVMLRDTPDGLTWLIWLAEVLACDQPQEDVVRYRGRLDRRGCAGSGLSASDRGRRHAGRGQHDRILCLADG